MSTVTDLLKQAKQKKRELHLERLLWGLLEEHQVLLEEFGDDWVHLVKLGWETYAQELSDSIKETLSESACYSPNRIISLEDEQAYLEILDILDNLPEEFE